MLRFLRIVIINSIVGTFLFSYLYYSETKTFLNLFSNFWLILWVIIGSNILGWLVILLNKSLDKFYTWKRSIIGRFTLELSSNYLLILGLIILSASLFSILILKTGVFEFINKYTETTLRILILSFITLFFYTIIDFAFYTYNQYSVVQIESVKLSREQLEVQFDALKSQLSPHFLFNNLNTVYSLIHQDANKTEHYIRMLAQIYQYILNTNNQKVVTIEDEVRFIEAYKYLLEIRFGDTLRININLSSEILCFSIPPMSLQILIENAVKHNSFDEESPLIIEIIDNFEFIIVRNNLSKAKPKVDSLKIGLDNLRKRYSYLTNKKLETISNALFIVRIPIIKNTIS